MEYSALMKDRYSVRKMDSRPVEEEKIEKILEAANLAPTATNAQPFRVWVFRSAAAVKVMREATTYDFGADLFFLVGGKKDEGWVRPYDGRPFADVDACIAATQMMLAIHDLGLGTTWVGKFDPEVLAKAYPETKDYDLIAVFPTAYPAKDAQPAPKHFLRKEVGQIAKIL